MVRGSLVLRVKITMGCQRVQDYRVGNAYKFGFPVTAVGVVIVEFLVESSVVVLIVMWYYTILINK